MNELELKQRTKQFALDIMDLTDELPRNTKEANELTAIMVASRRTIIARQKPKSGI